MSTLFPVEPSGSQPLDAPSPDDSAVVALVDRAVAHRDAHAFGELYEHYLEKVYRYLYFRTGSHAEAEDLSELVFLKAWEAIHRFRWQGRPFVAWLYRLAHNALVDHHRARRPTTSLDQEAVPRELPSEAAAVALAQQLDATVLAGALGRLTAEQQEVIVLRFVEDLDTPQIAALMDKREGAIRALQLRALQSLRRVLEEQGERGSR